MSVPTKAPMPASAIMDSVPLSSLDLDPQNPRFGDLVTGTQQAALLDLIVDRFGVADVISSIAVNGFFSAEPLVCEEIGGRLVVREGNRRLCAALIITGDPRAKNQSSLHSRYSKVWVDNGRKKIEPISVIKFASSASTKAEILAYLGVRHIASSQPWDSYAKAAWVAELQEQSTLDEGKIAEMIGDEHATVIRLLEGYQFVQQLIREDKFVPADSQRRGRGSVTEYPFSWVYTLLGFRSARDICGLSEVSGKRDPIPADKLDAAASLLRAAFGSKTLGRSAAIDDSRDLMALAQGMAKQPVASLINQGLSLRVAEEKTKPVEQRLSEDLRRIHELLAQVSVSIAETPPVPQLALTYLEQAGHIKRLAQDVQKALVRLTVGDDEN